MCAPQCPCQSLHAPKVHRPIFFVLETPDELLKPARGVPESADRVILRLRTWSGFRLPFQAVSAFSGPLSTPHGRCPRASLWRSIDSRSTVQSRQTHSPPVRHTPIAARHTMLRMNTV